MVYTSLEMLLEATSRFQTEVVRENNKFTRNLTLIAVDECHCVASWEEFRPLFDEIGKLRLLFTNVPFACLSATIMPHVAGWVHEAYKLK